MLFAYRQQVQRLLRDTIQARFNPSDLDSYINTARGQVALEGECIRNYASLTLAIGAQQYPFSSIVLATGTSGVAGVMNVRMATYQAAGGARRITSREWEYFNEFVLNNPVPVPGEPYEWAQYGQGAAGTLFFPLPDAYYFVNLDTVCYPLPLATDADPEAVPYAWTDAVPYYAAYVALLTAQQADAAAAMLKLYQTFAARARGFAVPSVLPHQYQQAPDPMAANRLGVTMPRANVGG